MHLVGNRGDRELVRKMVETGFLSLPSPTLADALRACALMRKYADIPMDFADASLVVMAEAFNVTQILTFDAHFYAYRIYDKLPFEVLL
jgi:predicted nucleic acid-binding protein